MNVGNSSQPGLLFFNDNMVLTSLTVVTYCIKILFITCFTYDNGLIVDTVSAANLRPIEKKC